MTAADHPSGHARGTKGPPAEAKIHRRLRAGARRGAFDPSSPEGLRQVLRELLFGGEDMPDWRRFAACQNADRDIFYLPLGAGPDPPSPRPPRRCAPAARCARPAWPTPLGGAAPARRDPRHHAAQADQAGRRGYLLLGLVAAPRRGDLPALGTPDLGQSIAECHEPETAAAAEHERRLAEEIRWTPCSPRCANWLLYGVAAPSRTRRRRPGSATVGSSATLARSPGSPSLRQVVDTITRRLDGQQAAGSVASKRRRVLFNALEFAVELGLLTANPVIGFKWKSPRVATAVDERSVVNPAQARTLLAAVREMKRRGPRLVAFFALVYFAALRPEEAANVRKHNLSLPVDGWGELSIDEATPRDQRQLKNRARGEGRIVPGTPELSALLHEHIATFGTGPDGRLFPGERATELPKLTYLRALRAARRLAFTPEVAASPLAATPYARPARFWVPVRRSGPRGTTRPMSRVIHCVSRHRPEVTAASTMPSVRSGCRST